MLWSRSSIPDKLQGECRGGDVAIYRLLQDSAFEPEVIELMSAAYELALMLIELKDRDDPLTETIARYIIESAQTGERDPQKMCSAALARLRAK
jgi:hypothetical protein